MRSKALTIALNLEDFFARGHNQTGGWNNEWFSAEDGKINVWQIRR